MTTRPNAQAQARGTSWRQQLAGTQKHAQRWWAERTPRERLLLSLGALVAGLALIWTAGLQPALRDIEQARQQLPRLHADAAQVDALILESQALTHRRSGQINAGALTDALDASLRRAGLEASSTSRETGATGPDPARQWEITLSNADAQRSMEWLSGLPYLLRLHIDSLELRRASIDGRDRPGHVSGRVIVSLPVKALP